MKKILKILICILFLTCTKVNASSYSMNLSSSITNVKEGEEVSVSISLNNISGIPNGLNACQASLSSSNVSINNIIGNGWNITNGNILIMDSSNSVTSSATIATIKATINGAGSITISNIVCSDGENEYSAGTKTIKFTLKDNAPQTTINRQTTTRRVTTTKTTTIPKKSSFLKSLTIEQINFEFKKNVLEYTFEVDNNVDKINLNYEPEDKNAKVEQDGNVNLVVGENKIFLVVTNEDSTTMYSLNIVRKGKITHVDNNEANILEALKQDIDTLNVKVNINDTNKNIESTILKYLKENNKNILYEIYDKDNIIYSIKIFGKNIENTKKINFNLIFNSNYKTTLDEKLNNYLYKIINFDYRGLLPKDTEIILYNMNFNDKIYLYDYNHNMDQIEFISEIENNNNIKLKLDKTSEYIITDYYHEQSNSMFIILYILLALIVGLVIIIIINKNKNKKKLQQKVVQDYEVLDIN